MSEKKKILIFIDWFLPGYKAGGPVRSIANITEHLSEDFIFKIITTDTDYSENIPYSSVKSNEWNTLSENVSVYYLSKDKLKIKTIKKLIKDTSFDIAYINGIYSFYFSILPLLILRKSEKKIIVASRGMLSEQAFSSKNIKKTIFLKFAGIFNLYKNVIFQATEKTEAENIKETINQYKKIITVSNLPQKTGYLKNKRRNKKQGSLKLVSIARISPEKNTLYAIQILRQLKYDGKIEFDLYGSVYNENYWHKCKEIIKTLPENISVNYKNSIENYKVHETFSKYHFSFMPSKGENFGHSILESFSAGCPVITSKNTPWQNLEEKGIGWDINLSNKEEFVKIIEKCADMSEKEYNSMSENTFNFAKKFSEKSQAITDTKKMFDDA